jgi:hypothetical protein
LCLAAQSVFAQLYQGNLNVVTANSTLTVSGNLSSSLGTVNYQQQGAGSLTASYVGIMNVNVDLGNNTIEFTAITAVTGNNSGSWQPLAGGAAGNAPANYGVFIPYLSGLVPVNAALRGVAYTVTTAVLPLTGGGASRTFANSEVIGLTAGNLDYRATGLFSGQGTSTLAGNSASNAAPGNGTLEILGGDQFRVTFPVDLTIPISFDASGTTFTATTRFLGSLQAEGFLVAVPEPTTWALLGMTVASAGFLAVRHRRQQRKFADREIR